MSSLPRSDVLPLDFCFDRLLAAADLVLVSELSVAPSAYPLQQWPLLQCTESDGRPEGDRHCPHFRTEEGLVGEPQMLSAVRAVGNGGASFFVNRAFVLTGALSDDASAEVRRASAFRLFSELHADAAAITPVAAGARQATTRLPAVSRPKPIIAVSACALLSTISIAPNR